jgi:hypothetical protein
MTCDLYVLKRHVSSVHRQRCSCCFVPECLKQNANTEPETATENNAINLLNISLQLSYGIYTLALPYSGGLNSYRIRNRLFSVRFLAISVFTARAIQRLALPPYQISWNLPSGSKDIHTRFITKTSNTLGTVLLYSKQIAPVAMVTSEPLCHFGPTVNYM